MRKKNLAVIIVVLLNLCLSSPVFAETIVFKWGTKVEANIIEKTEDYIKVEVGGTDLVYRLEDIESINGKPISTFQETPYTSPAQYPASTSPTTAEKSPSQVFKEVAPGVVVITTQLGRGSGVIVHKEGVIVTNFHVISGAEEIEVKLKDGRAFPVTDIIDYDALRDICVLKIDAQNLPVLSLSNSNTLEPGQKILVIGAPLGLEYTISDGLFSGLRVSNELARTKALQFTAPISKGNSGGPLLDMQGRVVGIVTRIKPGGQNLNFAIPINEAKDSIHKYPKMSMQEFSAKISRAYNFFHLGEQALMQWGNTNEAMSYFQKAIEIKPDMCEAYIFIGQIYMMLDNPEEAIPILEKAKEFPMNKRIHSWLYSTLGNGYCMLGRTQEGFLTLQKAIEIYPDNELAAGGMALALSLSGNHEKAIIYYKGCIEIRPTSAYYYRQLGKEYFTLNQPQEAKRCFLKAKQLIEDGVCSDAGGGKNLLPGIDKALSQLSTIY